MVSIGEECSVMKEIAKTEESIKSCQDRITKLEKRLELSDYPPTRRNQLTQELKEMKKLLAVNEKQLSTLHKHNRKSFVVVGIVSTIIFCLYGLYVLIYGPN